MKKILLSLIAFLPMLSHATTLSVGQGGGNVNVTINEGAIGVAVDDEGTFVQTFSTINCVGAGIACTDAGSGVLQIGVNGGAGSGDGVPTLQSPATGPYNLNNFGISRSTGIEVGGTQYTNVLSTISTKITAVAVDTTTLKSRFDTHNSTADAVLASTTSNLADNTKTINGVTNPVSWNALKDVPAGFADGSDDGAGGGGAVPTLQSPATGPYNLNGFGLSQSSGMETGGVQYTTLMSTIQAAIDRLSLSTTIVSLAESPDISERTYFVRDESTGFASNYRLLSSSPAVGSEITRSAQSITSANGLVRISSHITSFNDPGVLTLPAGVWSFTSWANASIVNGVTQLIVTISTVTSDGLTGEIVSSTSSDIDDTGSELLDMVAVQTTDISIATSTRLLVQYFARTTSALGVTVNLFYGGTSRFTHLTSPIGAVYKFIRLADAPSTLLGQAGKLLGVNNDQTATVFVSSLTTLATSSSTAFDFNASSSLKIPVSVSVNDILRDTGTIGMYGSQGVLQIGMKSGWERLTVPMVSTWIAGHANGADTITDDTVAGVETVFMTQSTIPANWLQIGRGVRVTAAFTSNCGASPPTLVMRMKLGNANVWATGAVAPGASVQRNFGLSFIITANAAPGGSVSVYTAPFSIIHNAGVNSTNTIAQPVTIATNAREPIMFSCQWASDVANTHSVTMEQLLVEPIGN